LKNGVIDDEIIQVLQTAKNAKNIVDNKYGVERKNLSQMLDFNKLQESRRSNKENCEAEDDKNLI
jgi:hypothetical protein